MRKNPACLTENGGRRVEDKKLRLDQGEMSLADGESRFDNSTMQHPHLLQISLSSFVANQVILRTF